MSDEERAEYLGMYGLTGSSLEGLISESYRLLGLISYFTFNENETRAWTIGRGWTAPQAAGVVHTDMERGFIRAEVIPYAVFERHQDRNAIKAAGLAASRGSRLCGAGRRCDLVSLQRLRRVRVMPGASTQPHPPAPSPAS